MIFDSNYLAIHYWILQDGDSTLLAKTLDQQNLEIDTLLNSEWPHQNGTTLFIRKKNGKAFNYDICP